ncbi:MAG: hydrogenase nickel incorporation protein HypB [Lachnospiraceae bacterium]|nr:hydrogenase nickel incorporation protein HypB [Lachnospiraceae bacterium]
MSEVKVIEIHENVFKANDEAADRLRKNLTSKKVCMINVMSSPGSGKTTALSKLINMLKTELNVGVMDVDIKTSMDAQKVADATGVRSLQIHNGGLCHIDAEMTEKAIEQFGVDGLDLVFIENIGNLVCPAEFDTGAHKNIMFLSVPEGDDKPLKYPLMFSVCDLIIISKMDTKDFFDFDLEKATKNIRKLNKKATIIPISAKTGEGMEELAKWVKAEVKEISGRA